MKKALYKVFGKSGAYEDLDKTPTKPAFETNLQVRKDSVTDESEITVDDAITSLGFGFFQIKMTLATGNFWMTDAMEVMMLSIIGPALVCEWRLASWQQAFLTSAVFAGMAISAGFWGMLSDKFGRRIQLFMCSCFTFYFGFLSIFSPNIVWLVILRGLVGVGIGGVVQSVTLYAELMPTTFRAMGILSMEIFWSLGTMLIVLVAMFVMPQLGWRYMFAFASLPAFLFLPICIWLPESPRFDLTQGRHDLALKTLHKIAKNNNKAPIKKRLACNEISMKERGRMVELWDRALRRTTILLNLIWLLSAVNYYGIVLMATELFQMNNACHAGSDTSVTTIDRNCYISCVELDFNDYLDIFWTALAEFPGLIVALFLIEIIGRRFTLGLLFLIFSLFILLINMCASRIVLTVFIFMARAAITGAFQVCFVYTPEVYPTRIRALALGVCNSVARAGSVITPFFAQVLLRSNIYVAINLYAVLGLMAALASLLLPIETKGKQLNDNKRNEEE